MAEDLENKDTIFPLFPYQGAIPVAVSSYLPYRQRYEYCDIETRKVYFIEGEWIHVLYIGNKFYCSREFFERLLQEEPAAILGKLNEYGKLPEVNGN